MEVNTNVYGKSDMWIDGDVNYNITNTPEEYRLKIANFTNISSTNESDGSILRAYQNGKLSLETPWDNTISFCGLGNKHPLTKIQYWGWDGKAENPKKLRIINSDNFDSVNFAIGFGGSGGDPGFITVDGYEYDAAKSKYNRWNNGAEYNDIYSAWQKFKPIVKIPLKRNVLVPIVFCYRNNDTWKTSSIFEIGDYLTKYKNEYPRIVGVGAKIYTSDGNETYNPETGDGNVERRNLGTLTCGVVLQNVSYGNGYNDLENCYKPIFGQTFMGALANVSMPDNQGSNTWVVPIANGFGLDFTNYSPRNNNGEMLNNARFYLNANNYSADDLRDSIFKAISCYGMFFCDSETNARTLKLDDEQMYLGIIVDGIGNGDYTHGADNKLQSQWFMDDVHEFDYDPSNPPIPDRNSDPVTFNPVALADGGLKRYVLDDNAMSAFGVDLYRVIDTSNPDELIQNQTLTNFLTNNPLDAVVSVKRFPLPDMSQGDLTNIMLGKVRMQTDAKPFTSTATILTCGSINIPAKFGNFLDYETQYELILPFCGTISLDPKIVTGKNVEVKYSIDYTTGTCTAWILAITSDGVETVIDSANGNCTIDIPLSGVQTATLTGEIYNANENLKTAKFNAVVNTVSGIGEFARDVKSHDVAGGAKTVANAVNSIHDIKKAEWNINNTQIPFKMIGASSGCNSFQIELIPRLNVYYPIVDSAYNVTDYRHNVGAAVCDTTTISDYSGYAEITNVDLSGFVATAEEKNMIANALMGGVYL